MSGPRARRDLGRSCPKIPKTYLTPPLSGKRTRSIRNKTFRFPSMAANRSEVYYNSSEREAQSSFARRPENVRKMTLRLHSLWNGNRLVDGKCDSRNTAPVGLVAAVGTTGFQYGISHPDGPTLENVSDRDQLRRHHIITLKAFLALFLVFR